MNKEYYDSINEDYKGLLIAAGEIMERFKDYTPQMKDELDSVIRVVCSNCEDLPKAVEIIQNIGNYIIYRYNELNEYKKRRENVEKELMDSLPELFDQLAVPNANSCSEIATAIKKFDTRTNYQVLVHYLITTLAKL